MVAWILPFL